MEVKALVFDPKEVKEPLAVFLFEDDWSSLDLLGEVGQKVKKLLEVENFKGKEESLAKVSLLEDGTVRVFYAVGLGKREKVGQDNYRTGAGLLAKRAGKDKVKSLYVYAGDVDYKLSKALTEGLLLGSYRFDKYKTKKRRKAKRLRRCLSTKATRKE